MFEIFAEKVWRFKELFFLVIPKSEAALDTLLEAAKDGVQERRPLFHLCWSQDHFGYEPGDFCRTLVSLSEEETDTRQQLWALVQSLPRKVKTDKRGNPLMNADETLVTEPRLINTHELLTSEDFEECLGSLFLLICSSLACFCVLSFRSDEFFPFYVLHEK